MLECKLEELKLGGIDIIRNICERLTKDQSYGGQSEPVWEPPTKEIISSLIVLIIGKCQEHRSTASVI